MKRKFDQFRFIQDLKSLTKIFKLHKAAFFISLPPLADRDWLRSSPSPWNTEENQKTNRKTSGESGVTQLEGATHQSTDHKQSNRQKTDSTYKGQVYSIN